MWSNPVLRDTMIGTWTWYVLYLCKSRSNLIQDTPTFWDTVLDMFLFLSIVFFPMKTSQITTDHHFLFRLCCLKNHFESLQMIIFDGSSTFPSDSLFFLRNEIHESCKLYSLVLFFAKAQVVTQRWSFSPRFVGACVAKQPSSHWRGHCRSLNDV